ncbi:MAG: carbohydrate ABC transporter permease [Lachnospiraceae bacterium]|nr:carbohydrate ABC transporter permease [Lachnospiraceae bacterium]
MKKYTYKTAIIEVLAILLALVFLYPIFLVFINAFKSGSEIVMNMTALPTKLHFDNFAAAWEKMNFGRAFLNTLFITVASVAGIIVLSSAAAYKMERYNNIVSKCFSGLLVFSMVIPSQVLMIPLVQVARQFGLINNLWGMVFIYWGGNMAMSIFLYSGFVKTVPIELEEAAIIDGAGPFKTFFSIVLPLLKPITSTIAIMSTMSVFNDFMIPRLILTRDHVVTIQVAMQKFYDSYQTDWSGVMAGLTLTMLPMLIFFLIMQRNLMDSMVTGAVKG